MTKLKKTALTVLVLGMTSIANAAEYPTPPDLPYGEGPQFYDVPNYERHGLYVGLGGGIIDFNNKMTVSADGTVDGTAFNDSTSPTSNNAAGALGTLILGYSWTLPSRFFFGIEGFGDITSAEISQTNTANNTTGPISTTLTGTTDLQWQYVYGARVLPGFQVSPKFTLYGIVGYARGVANLTNAETRTTIDSATGGSVTVDTSSDSGIFSAHDYNGYQLGVGSMFNLSSHLALRGDIIYTGYGSQTLGSDTHTFVGGNETTSLDASPYTVEADLSLVLMFG